MFSNIQKYHLQNCLPWSWMSQCDLYNCYKSLLAGAEKEIKKRRITIELLLQKPKKKVPHESCPTLGS